VYLDHRWLSGMSISVRTNIQTADLAENSFSSAFRMAVYGGGSEGFAGDRIELFGC
jgi:Na+/H+-translocating membrane pyrophosphatase